MYLAPWASSAFLIAASSVFQRSSWKFDHDTPTVRSFAIAAKETTLADASKTAPIAKFFNDFIDFLPYDPRTGGDASKRAPLQPKPDNFRRRHNGQPRHDCQCAKGTRFCFVPRAWRRLRSSGFGGAWNALAAPALDMRDNAGRAHRPWTIAAGGP